MKRLSCFISKGRGRAVTFSMAIMSLFASASAIAQVTVKSFTDITGNIIRLGVELLQQGYVFAVVLGGALVLYGIFMFYQRYGMEQRGEPKGGKWPWALIGGMLLIYAAEVTDAMGKDLMNKDETTKESKEDWNNFE
jgi:hypothetical protein